MAINKSEEEMEAVAVEATTFFEEKAKEFIGTQVMAKRSSVPEVKVKVSPDKKGGVKASIVLKWTF